MRMPTKLKPLWRCPKCGNRFVTRNMWHSCGKYQLGALFAHCEPHVFRLFRKFEKMMRRCGPVTMIPQKTRIVFQTRVRFGGCYPRKSYLLCGLALPQVHIDPRFVKVNTYAPHFHGHLFRVESLEQLDRNIQNWMREAYTVGQQLHVKKR